MTIEAKIICDSIGEHSPRLVTMLVRYPKFVHSEHLRHRSFSFSVSSSRAIPVAKNLEEVRSDDLRAAPVWWGREQKGMQSGEELPDIKNPDDVTSEFYKHGRTELETAKNLWRIAAHYAESCAERMQQLGAHKSIVNRLLEPFLHVNVLVTGTTPGWMNFFGLRLDRAAQPEIRALAEAQWRVWNESTPQKLEPGQWHLPFIDNDDWYQYPQDLIEGGDGYSYDQALDNVLKVSVARCARLSYSTFESPDIRSWHTKDLELYDRLVGSSPIHASPAEHQATPDEWRSFVDANIQDHVTDRGYWRNVSQAGNLGPGWRQYRKMLPNEAVAPLPEGYK